MGSTGPASGTPASRLADAIPASWRGLLAGAVADPGFGAVAAFVEAERRRVDVYPPADLVFSAKDNLERKSADGIAPERAVEWLQAMSATWRSAEVPAEK